MIRITSDPRSRLALGFTGATLLVTGLLAGCTTSDRNSPEASPSGDSRSASAQLGQCLRAAGYDVDDPDISKGIVIIPPDGVDADEYAKDFQTCADGVGGDLAGSGEVDPATTAKRQKASLKVAQCMRDKGFDDFPDPVDGFFTEKMSTDQSDPTAAAFTACDAEFGVEGDSK